jgi:hypothetical protein
VPHEIPDLPGVSTLVLRETDVYVSLNEASADVRVETAFNLPQTIGDKYPDVSAECAPASTWTFSGAHKTQSNGKVTIHLNKFLECVSASIDSVTSDRRYMGGVTKFTTTPESEDPVLLTCTIDSEELKPDNRSYFFFPTAFDVKITVMSWNVEGNPASYVGFNWIAVARTAQLAGV